MIFYYKWLLKNAKMYKGDILESYINKSIAYGFSHAVELDCATLKLLPEIRDMCSADKCNMYGKNWSCPPACGTLEENAAIISGFARGIIVQTTGVMEDAFDIESINATQKQHTEMFASYRNALSENFPNLIALGAGGCRICSECTYPIAPCRYPDRLIVSMEACGLWVSDVCQKNNISYYYGPDTITFTSCFLLI